MEANAAMKRHCAQGHGRELSGILVRLAYVFIIFTRRLNNGQRSHIDFVRDGIGCFMIFVRMGRGFHIDAHDADRVRFVGAAVFVLPQ